MSAEVAGLGDAELHVENIGGIAEEDVTFRPGVTVLEGRNATNRSSLLRALMAACGSDDVSVKGDADEGRVELTIGAETFTRHLERENGSIAATGEPYLDDPLLADMFAFLLESNDVRRAVERGDDLRELLMRPIDTDQIEAKIDRLVQDRNELEAELDEIESLRDELPDLEKEWLRLEERVQKKRQELDETEAAIEAANADVDTEREEKAELEENLETLRETRSRLEEARYDLQTERESLEALEEEKRDLEDEVSELPEAPVGDVEELEAEIGRLRNRKQSVETEINDLQSMVRFNEEMVKDADPALLEALSPELDGSAITDQLVETQQTTCWTCGQDVEVGRIQETIDTLRQLSQRKLDESRSLQNSLEESTEERQSLEAQQQEREQIQSRLAAIERKISRRQSTIEQLGARVAEFSEEVDSTEEEVEALQAETHDEILDLQREASQLEYELGRVDSELERVERRIATIEERLSESEGLEAEGEALQEEITDLRTTLERVAEQTVEEFNQHMTTVLDILHYGNLERIWLERVEREDRGRRAASANTFTLHVARSTDSGVTYQDTIDHLSESEREVTGLILALTGYLVHDVHETFPVLLLDSLEAIDAERIATIIDYFSDYTGYLVVALLPEDASEIEADNRLVLEA